MPEKLPKRGDAGERRCGTRGQRHERRRRREEGSGERVTRDERHGERGGRGVEQLVAEVPEF